MTIQYVNFPSYKPWTGAAGGDAPPPPALPTANQPALPPMPGAPTANVPGQQLPAGNQPPAPDSVPAPNGVVAPDNWAPSANGQQLPAQNGQQMPPGYNGQQLPPGYPGAQAFSMGRAMGHFFKGFFNEGIDMVKGAIQHPLQTAAIMAAGAAACFFLPWAGTAMTVAFAALGAFKMFKGWQASQADRAAGNFAQAEADFDAVGRGTFDVALAIGPSLYQRWLNKVRGQGPHVGEAPKSARTRAPRGAKPKAPKTPKAVEPTVEPTIEPASVEPKPVKVRTRTRAAKPASEATTIGKAPKAGRAHVGFNKNAGGNPQEAHVGTAPEKPIVKPIEEPTAGAAKPTVEPAEEPVAKVTKKPAAKPTRRPAAKKPAAKKPAAEVTTIDEKPGTGRPHVGRNKAAGGNPQEAHVGSAPKKQVRTKRTAPRRAKAEKPTATDDQTLRTVKGRLEAAMKEIDRLLTT